MKDVVDPYLPSYCGRRVLILGCGNRLFGDDGFGCEVAEYLSAHYEIPDDVCVMDAGTGVRKVLFTLSIDPVRPGKIVIVDAIDSADGRRRPGEIFEITPDELPDEKKDDFSLHQVPSSNLVRELSECGIHVQVLVCQTGSVPDSVRPGLSGALADAVPPVSGRIAREAGLKPPVRARTVVA